MFGARGTLQVGGECSLGVRVRGSGLTVEANAPFRVEGLGCEA